ncbi:unnamed protein product [uncultured bacterium]|nr:unnamed protein product [uncultured bacterium]
MARPRTKSKNVASPRFPSAVLRTNRREAPIPFASRFGRWLLAPSRGGFSMVCARTSWYAARLASPQPGTSMRFVFPGGPGSLVTKCWRSLQMKVLQVNLGRSVSLAFVAVSILGAAAKAHASQPLAMLDQSAIANKPGIKFAIHKKPWRDVLVWLAEKYDLPLTTSRSLKGTFTFIGPKGRTYSLRRILEMVNEALVAQHECVLIRAKHCLMLVPVSEAPPRAVP